MNNSFDKYHHHNSYQSKNTHPIDSYFIKDEIEHTFDLRTHHQLQQQQQSTQKRDSRTEDQVITNLNFSIEDLLSKISKATAEFDEPPKFNKLQSKPEYPAIFKLSNLSASTEATSNQQRSDPFIEKYNPHPENTRKSQPRTEIINNEIKTKNGLGQKQNSLYQTLPSPTNQLRNQLRSESYNPYKNTSQKNQDFISSFEHISQNNYQPTITYQWGRHSSRNQLQSQNNVPQWGRNSSRNQHFQETHEQFHQLKQQNKSQKIDKWNSPYHETKINNFQKHGSLDISQTENKIDDFQNQWKKYQQKMSSLRNQSKTQKTQNFSFKNIEKQDGYFGQLKADLIVPQKKQFTSQPQIHIISHLGDKQIHSATNSPKRQAKGFQNTIQTSAFGQINHNPMRNKEYKKSIILNEDLPSSCQPVPGEKKVDSLFDGKRIRQVAASTIIDSPDKEKKLRMQNPFNQILQTNNHQHQLQQHTSHYQNLHEPLNNIPTIKINTVQKSQIIQNHNTRPKMTIQDFHLGKQLGSGKFGDVYQAVHKATGLLFAIKKIFKSTILEYNMIEQFTRQLKIHYSLNYPNIIKLYTHFDDEYHVFLVMEYGQGGMLMEKVKNGQKFSSIIVQQMLRAVEYLHNKKIAHRDIKPQNIVLMFGDTAKLCDFGWSRVFDSDMKKTFCGTLDYVSPQMKDKGEYSLKIDVWSLGVLTFELLCGFAPFKDEITNWKKKGGNMNKAWNWNILYPPDISSMAQGFMRNLLKQNPEQRANIRFCLNHLFIRKYNQMSFNEEEQKVFRQVSMILKDD